jgi:prepilin-type N-terminal cleavage/methylation domain-containing protein
MELQKINKQGKPMWRRRGGIVKNKSIILAQKGFTLIELMSVLVIMGVMVSVSMKKFDLLSDTASLSAIKAGIRELNTRETLVWTQMKLSETDWAGDDVVYNAVDKNLGTAYWWKPPGPTISAGILHYKSKSVNLDRIGSTRNSVGSWQ